MGNLLLVNMDKCTGCKQCALACSLTKEDLFDPHRSRIKVMKKEDIALGIQLLCEQCDEHPCTEECPEGALTKNEKTGVIDLEVDLCTQCGICEDACPYHGIRYHPETELPLICDLCGGDPYCVHHCVPEALIWVKKSNDAMKEKKRLRSARMAMYRELKKEAA